MRVRSAAVRAEHDALGDACLAWEPEGKDTPLRLYVERHGVAHLLGNGRKTEAEQRMLISRSTGAAVSDSRVAPIVRIGSRESGTHFEVQGSCS